MMERWGTSHNCSLVSHRKPSQSKEATRAPLSTHSDFCHQHPLGHILRILSRTHFLILPTTRLEGWVSRTLYSTSLRITNPVFILISSLPIWKRKQGTSVRRLGRGAKGLFLHEGKLGERSVLLLNSRGAAKWQRLWI